ncbi:hypothetical protein [Lewinella sp. W8]|uniref:hypothetical protein n=1 Tax=Lewinella sp. W8 TaxID=2528208 RepID=UPI0010672F44|nr:hypothetical protein [Lewinella sp. W8]MTB49792.1 hypothetical protein [Lewinella sp. W8]
MRLPLCLFLFLITPSLTAQSSLFDDLMAVEDEWLDVILRFPDGAPQKDTIEVDAIFQVVSASGPHSMPAGVRVRGRYRLVYCTNKPMNIDFKRGSLRDHGFAEFDKYKLVVPCHEGEENEAALMREFLAYRVYNELTPYSFRVRLIRLTLVVGENQLQTIPAFIIENDEELANRLNLKQEDNHFGHTAEDFYADTEPTQAFFQYFIANGDWSIPTGQNLKLFRTQDDQLIPIGYDFDFSGWVGAPYARKRSSDGRLDLQDQQYLSMTKSEAVHRSVREKFMAHEDAIVDIVRKHRDLRRYVKQFSQKIAVRLKSDE